MGVVVVSAGAALVPALVVPAVATPVVVALWRWPITSLRILSTDGGSSDGPEAVPFPAGGHDDRKAVLAGTSADSF